MPGKDSEKEFVCRSRLLPNRAIFKEFQQGSKWSDYYTPVVNPRSNTSSLLLRTRYFGMSLFDRCDEGVA